MRQGNNSKIYSDGEEVWRERLKKQRKVKERRKKIEEIFRQKPKWRARFKRQKD